MARNYRYRAKRADNQEWVFGYYVVTPENQHRIYLKPFEGCSTNTYFIIQENTVGMMWEPSYGLIAYGGDLFYANCSINTEGAENIAKRLVVITESNSGHSVSVIHQGVLWAYKSMDFTSFYHVGNIHDNPELLNQ